MYMASPEAAAASCDELFNRTVAAVEKRLHLLGRLPKVRIKAWLAKLKVSTSNLTWKRNRNLYAKLLLEQLRAGCLEVPFNALPPEGGLPTLPSYLTYRFLSPPPQRSPNLDGYEEQQRPSSAGANGGFYRCRSSGSHDAYTVMRASAPMQLQHPHPNTAGVAPNLAGYPVLSPLRCGSPPRQGYLPSSQQQQFNSPNSRSRRYSRPVQASYPSSEGQQVSPTKGRGQVVPIEAGIAGGCGVQQQQRSASPGAAGLLNAAAVLAAEVEAGRGDAAVLDSRLRFAEDKLLQQEAELVRLQGQAVAARRRLKAATASTLGDLVERYSSATAAWGSPGSSPAAARPPSRQGAYADAVYAPMWQLISGMQQVLDTCDQQDFQWQHAQSGAVAAAIARYEAEWAAQEQQQALDSSQAAAEDNVGPARQLGDVQQAAQAAAAAAAVALKQLKEILGRFLQQAEQVVAAMTASKNAATAAAAGGRVTAAEVAAGAADSLAALLKSSKRFISKHCEKVVQQLEAAADAVAAADGGGRRSSSSSSDMGSRRRRSSSSSDSSQGVRGRNNQQQVLQESRAQLGRLQAAHRLAIDLESSTNKIFGQLSDGQKRLLDVASSSNGSSLSNSVLASHDRGLAAAATAGITASLAAATSTYVAQIKDLKQQLKAVLKASALGHHLTQDSDDGKLRSFDRSNRSALKLQDTEQHMHQRHGFSRSATTAIRSGNTAQQQQGQMQGLGRASSTDLRFEASNVPLSPRQSDSTLAGTFGAAGVLSSPRGVGPHPGAKTDLLAGKFNSLAHYLIGGAVASTAVAAGGSSSLLSRTAAVPTSPRLTSPLQLPTGGTSFNAGVASPRQSSGSETVHQRLASLSKQASNISERASQILGSNEGSGIGGNTTDALAGGLSGRLGSSSPSLLNAKSGSLLSTGLAAAATSNSPFRAISHSALPTGGASLLHGGGLRTSPVSLAAPGRLPNAGWLSPVAAGGVSRGTGSLLSTSVAGVPRAASASPRLVGLGSSSSLTSGLLGSGSKPSALGSTSLASLSSRLSNLGRI